ncbi:hypothetical protein LDENG_00232150, partial [Lucifuga dentata]
KDNIQQLQLLQNAAARLSTRSRTSDHINLILAGFHCLPVCIRIDFKVLLVVFFFKALYGQALSNIHDLLTCYKPDCHLRSPDVTSLQVTGLFLFMS